MLQFEFDFDEVDVRAEFDSASWHPSWCEVVPCVEAELDWDDVLIEEEVA